MQNKAIAPETNTERTTVTEFAIVKVSDHDQALTQRDQALDEVSGWPGFVRALKLQGSDDPAILADIVLWQNIEAATKAAEEFEKHTVTAAYGKSVSDILLIDHATQLGDNEDWSITTPDGVLETAISSVNDPAGHHELQEQVHNFLESTKPYKCSWRFKGATKPALSVDMVNWADRHAAEETAKTVMAKPEFTPFFEGAAKLHYFGFFRIIGVVESKQ